MVRPKLPLSPLLGALLLLASAGPAGAEYFTVESFASDVVVGESGDLVVREEIVVRFTAPRHGIYRDLPFRYTDSLGGAVRTPLRVLAVTDGEGVARRYRITRSGDALRVRIGRPERFVEGRQVYAVTYSVENAILRLPDRDELAWNVTGNGWDASMASVSATVTLPPAAADRIIGSRCYTGPRGSTAAACVSSEGSRSVRFSATVPLRPREGLTVAVGWPSGIVGGPSGLRRLLMAVNARENWVFLLPLAALGLVFLRWLSVGRDPGTGPVAVMFGPPRQGDAELTPAEVGGLVDERFDSRDLTGAVVGLAVKGFLRIEERVEDGLIFSRRDFHLSRLKEGAEGLTPFEARLMKGLFPGALGGRLVSELKNTFYLHLDGLRDTLFRGLVGKGYFRSLPERVRMWYRSAGIVLAGAGALAGANAGRLFPLTADVKNIVAFTLPGLLVLLFARHMPAKTRRGARAAAQVRGFEEFLSRAEKDRLERMEDLNLFEKFLPYAIALNVSERWAMAFEGIEQEPPRWYAGASPWRGGFRPAIFGESLGGALASMSTNMYAAPRSSGGSGSFSGGGGFSGGGFGGGGGGSW